MTKQNLHEALSIQHSNGRCTASSTRTKQWAHDEHINVKRLSYIYQVYLIGIETTDVSYYWQYQLESLSTWECSQNKVLMRLFGKRSNISCVCECLKCANTGAMYQIFMGISQKNWRRSCVAVYLFCTFSNITACYVTEHSVMHANCSFWEQCWWPFL